MLPKVAVGLHCCAPSTNVENYRALVGDDLVEEIQQFSRDLKDVRVCRVNATASGGGVAELLGRQIPLYHALGIQVDWRIIHGDKDFFTVTKGFHDALQGAEFRVTSSVAEEYQEQNRLSEKMLDGPYDVYLVCDPQPAALRHFKEDNGSKWIWRCHIDSSERYPEVWQFLRPYVESYDAAVFTMKAFQPPDLKMQRVVFIPPAIAPGHQEHGPAPRPVPLDSDPSGLCSQFYGEADWVRGGAFNTAGYTEAIRAHRTFDWSRCGQGGQHGHMWEEMGTHRRMEPGHMSGGQEHGPGHMGGRGER